MRLDLIEEYKMPLRLSLGNVMETITNPLYISVG